MIPKRILFYDDSSSSCVIVMEEIGGEKFRTDFQFILFVVKELIIRINCNHQDDKTIYLLLLPPFIPNDHHPFQNNRLHPFIL